MQRFRDDLRSKNEARREKANAQRKILVEQQRVVRERAFQNIQQREVEETKARQARFSTGLRGVWDWLRGENRRIRDLNEIEAKANALRDQRERDDFIRAQKEQRIELLNRQRFEAERMRDQFKLVQSDANRFSQLKETASHGDLDTFKERRRKADRPRRSSRSEGTAPSRKIVDISFGWDENGLHHV